MGVGGEGCYAALMRPKKVETLLQLQIGVMTTKSLVKNSSRAISNSQQKL